MEPYGAALSFMTLKPQSALKLWTFMDLCRFLKTYEIRSISFDT
jgi:hypothetical protein